VALKANGRGILPGVSNPLPEAKQEPQIGKKRKASQEGDVSETGKKDNIIKWGKNHQREWLRTGGRD